MDDKRLKMYLPPMVIREIKTKTAMKYHLVHPPEWLKLKKINKTNNVKYWYRYENQNFPTFRVEI